MRGEWIPGYAFRQIMLVPILVPSFLFDLGKMTESPWAQFSYLYNGTIIGQWKDLQRFVSACKAELPIIKVILENPLKSTWAFKSSKDIWGLSVCLLLFSISCTCASQTSCGSVWRGLPLQVVLRGILDKIWETLRITRISPSLF